ncbi:putative Ras-related protein Rab-33 [Arctopsyche grandis]|uniref:putative Ras-related protein Rab-33 n=1 Tax=Arctopsyche grandis TaxID=121162 RepID=UPI00406D6B66
MSCQVEGLQQTKILKVIVVGDSSVGKTCLTYRFCERKFLRDTDATIGVDFYDRIVNISGTEIRLQLWDTAGQERFRESMIQHYYRNVHAVVIVYDITKINSFNSINSWVQECSVQGLGSEVPRVLVGMKCDQSQKRAVSLSAAQRLADYHGMPLFETSACLESEMETVDAIFLTIAHKLNSQRPFKVVSIDSNANKKFSIKRTTRRIRSTSVDNNCC